MSTYNKAMAILSFYNLEEQYHFVEASEWGLPIVEHCVNVQLQGEKPLNVFEHQILQFIKEHIQKLEDLERLLCLPQAMLNHIIECLQQKQLIELKENEWVLTEAGERSAYTGYAPSKLYEKQVNIYFEPVTKKYIQLHELTYCEIRPIHPAADELGNNIYHCAELTPAGIADAYRDVYEHSLFDVNRECKVEDVQVESDKMSLTMPIFVMWVQHQKTGELICKVWNELKNDFEKTLAQRLQEKNNTKIPLI